MRVVLRSEVKCTYMMANLPSHSGPSSTFQIGLVISAYLFLTHQAMWKTAGVVQKENIKKSYTSDKSYTLAIAFHFSMSIIPSYVIML